MYINHVQLPDKLNIKGNQYLIEAWLPHLYKDVHALPTQLCKVWLSERGSVHLGNGSFYH